ncbi:MAG TPA: YpdA family putative bacillithiol disulfide reductase [Gemmatimonadaceae bacterium]|nr:YpdA family putative bacillithiol disulfide reductase [Gemmatimonadaceae bacterium]
MVDVAIIGGGPCGLAAAVAVKRAGFSHVVIEKGAVADSIAKYPTYVTFFSTAERVSIAGIPFVVATEKPTRREALAYYRAVVTHEGLDVRQDEHVHSLVRDGKEFVVTSELRTGEKRETRTRAVVIATGYFGTPNMLGVPGEDLPHVSHWYREGHEAFQRDVIVVGGGNSGAETALDLFRSGARVTLVHFGPAFNHVIKPWVLADVEGRMQEGSIAVRWNTRVTEIRPGAVILERREGGLREGGLREGGLREIMRADRVYLMTGYTPSSELLGPLGISFDPETGIPEHDPATMETPVPGVFIAGVLASGNDANKIFIENGRDHGELIARHLRAGGLVG